MNKEDGDNLKNLEESLWRSETRFDDAYMDQLLAPDFFEFGRSGRIYQREDTIGVPPQDIDAKLPLRDFQIHPIDQDTVLATYVSEVIYGEETEVANRSSLWSKSGGAWRLRFHQGTPVTE